MIEIIPVTDLLDIEHGDEVPPDDEKIERCSCGVLFPRGSWHRCEDTGERVEWAEYQNGAEK